MAESFTTQSSNFLSAMSGAVDPRTGMYGYNIAIASLTGNAGLGPDLAVTLNYSPLTTGNSGFGNGVVLPLSRYDKGTRTLQLSTGERYRVNEANGKLNIIHAKPINVRAEIHNDGYYLFYKNGTIEKLTSPSKGGNIKVTEVIHSPAGRLLNLNWENYGNDKRLLSISDENALLLSIKYTASGVTFSIWPNTAEAHDVALKLQNNQLISVINRSVSPVLTWTLGYNNGRLTTVTSPTGLKDIVTYSQTGHRFPKGGPTSTVPYVISYRQTGIKGALLSDLRYQFSDKNFLGYGGSNQASWSSDSDFLYGVLGGYEYSSTETALDEKGKELSRIVRTYNNYHLQTKELRTMVGTTCQTLTETDYYAVAGKNFDDQPAQFQLPKKQTVTMSDSSKPESERTRKEITFTEFDAQGNPLRQENPDGTVMEYEYYPANGEEELCPPDPHGFIRFQKKKTIIPRATNYTDTPPSVTEFTYSLLGDTGCVVQTGKKEYAGSQLLSVNNTFYDQESDSKELGRITSITDTLYTGKEPFTTKQLFTTDVNDELMTQSVTTIGHDGIRTVYSRTQSIFSGLLFSETDSQNIMIKYEYDLLGRMLSRTVAADTIYAHTEQWQYTLEDTGPVTLQKDARGNQLKTLFDSAGRQISQQKLDTDNTNLFYEVAAQQFDLLGRPLKSETCDWQTDRSNATKYRVQMTVSHDNWGMPLMQSFSDLTQYHQEVNPVLLTRTSYALGGKSRNVQHSGKKTTILDKKSVLPVKELLTDTGGQIQGERLYDWDGLGRLRLETDELGNTTARTYDVYGRVLTQSLPDGSIVSRTYAPHLLGEQVATISVAWQDAEGQEQTCLLGNQKFDSLGRVTERTSGGRTTLYKYLDASPMPSEVTLPSGKKMTYSYIPEMNNVVSSMTADDVTQTFDYDSITSKLLVAKEGNTQNNNYWSASGNLKGEAFTQMGVTRNTSYDYTLAGAVTACIDITGKKTGYVRDEFGRVIAINDEALNVSLAYDELGRLKQQVVTDNTMQSSLTTTLEYDDFGREIARTVTDSTGTRLDVLQTWLLNGLLNTRTTSRDGTLHREEQYSYDVRNRLVSYIVSGSSLPPDAYGHEMTTQTYQYDVLNNLTTVITTLVDGKKNIATYLYENKKDPTQLTTVTHSHDGYPQAIYLKYDAEGRMTQDEAGRTLIYDVPGRLAGINGEGITGGSYGYDALNRLISQNVDNKDSRWLYYRGSELVNEVLVQQKRELRLLKNGHTCLGVSEGNSLTLTAADKNDSLLWSREVGK